MMKRQKYFPAIEEVRNNGQVRITAAIRLASLQSVRLREKDSFDDEPEKQIFPYFLHRPLLHAMADFPENYLFSLNMVSSPNPAFPLSGKVDIAILLTSIGEDRQVAISDMLGRYANFFSLLSNFLPHAEFEIVKGDVELRKWIAPFTPETIYSIDRYQDTFSLTKDSKVTEKRNLGFLTTGINCEKTESINYTFPWWQENLCDLANIIEALLCYPSPVWYQVRLRPTRIGFDYIGELNESLNTCEELINGVRSSSSLFSAQVHTLRTAISERIWQQNRAAFLGGCFLSSESDMDEALVSAVAGQISPLPFIKEQRNISLVGGNSTKVIDLTDFLDPNYFSPLGVFTADEATCAFRIPFARQQDPPGLPVKSYRTGVVSSNILHEDTQKLLFLGNNRHRGHINPVHVSNDDRMRHICIMGQTGTGKSAFLESLILQDIYRGNGCCFIDPHGDSIEKILHFYPRERVGDLVLIDFLDRSRVVPFNLLVWKDEEERDRIIDDLYGWLDHTYDMKIAGGPIFEQYFRGFLRLLMGDEPRTDFQPTIPDFIRLFTDKQFRDYCLEKCRDHQVIRMIEQAKVAGGDAALVNVAPYITSKFNRFDLDKALKMMVGQESMPLDFQEVMDKKKVMLVNICKGRLGESIFGLLAGQIVSRFQSAALKRIHMKAEKRRDFFLYVDEFQNVASETFISLLSEARKFRLGLILANQYADQLEKRKTGSGDSVLKAILGNVGNTTCFRLGINDAATMSGVFHPEFNSEDLVNLPVGNCYVNLKTSITNPSIFSLETRYFKAKDNPEYVRNIRNASNEKYSISSSEAEHNLTKHNEKIDSLS